MKAFSGIVLLCCLYVIGANAQTLEITQQIFDDHKKVQAHLYNELIPFLPKTLTDSTSTN